MDISDRQIIIRKVSSIQIMSSVKKATSLPYKVNFQPDYIQISEMTERLMKEVKNRAGKQKPKIQMLNNQLFEITDTIEQQDMQFFSEEIYHRCASMKEAEEKMKAKTDLCTLCGNPLKKIVQCEFCAQVCCKDCCWRKRCIPGLNDKEPKSCCEICHKKYVRLLNNQSFFQEKQLIYKIIDTTRNKTEKIALKSSQKEQVLYAYNIKKRNQKIKETQLLKMIQEEERKLKQTTEEFARIVVEKAEKIKLEEQKIRKQEDKRREDQERRKEADDERARKADLLQKEQQDVRTSKLQEDNEREQARGREREREREQAKEQEREQEAKRQEDKLRIARLQQEEASKLRRLELEVEQLKKSVSRNEKDSSPSSPISSPKRSEKSEEKMSPLQQPQDSNHSLLLGATEERKEIQSVTSEDPKLDKVQKIQQNSAMRETPKKADSAPIAEEFKLEPPDSATTSKSEQQPAALEKKESSPVSKPLNPSEMSLNDILNAKVPALDKPLRLSKRQSVSSELEVEELPAKGIEPSEKIQQFKRQLKNESNPKQDAVIRKSRQSLLRNSSMMSSVKTAPKEEHPQEGFVDDNNKCSCEIM